MTLDILNKLCFTLIILCILAGIGLALAMIWGVVHDSNFAWKSWLTIGVFFVASVITMNVTKVFAK
ncbi:MAG: hypothetical protein Q9O24_10930 [Gammaproteobacteria bacterium]|nr:hypothetical protein [Gammaproteobacteria bacterium]MDQ7075640.1 hypothetical protein [Gammaproteobacteria bacterium]